MTNILTTGIVVRKKIITVKNHYKIKSNLIIFYHILKIKNRHKIHHILTVKNCYKMYHILYG